MKFFSIETLIKYRNGELSKELSEDIAEVIKGNQCYKEIIIILEEEIEEDGGDIFNDYESTVQKLEKDNEKNALIFEKESSKKDDKKIILELDIPKQDFFNTEYSLLNYDNVEKALNLLQACNNRIRQQFLEILLRHDELSIGEIAKLSKIWVGDVKAHITLMLRAGVILNKAKGKEIVYYLNEDKLRQIKRALGCYFMQKTVHSEDAMK